ncbi:hypothetical protein MXB_4095, partial [Myxobolus squamalis]
MKIILMKFGKTHTTLRWKYSQIKKYEIVNNIFSFKIMNEQFFETNGNEKLNVSYFLTINQPADLKRSFEKYSINIPSKSISYKRQKAPNTLGELQSRYPTIKSNNIFHLGVGSQPFYIQASDYVIPVTNK